MLLSAPYIDYDPISSWSKSINILTSALSFDAVELTSIRESREVKLLPRLSSLAEDTNSLCRPTKHAYYESIALSSKSTIAVLSTPKSELILEIKVLKCLSSILNLSSPKFSISSPNS